MSEIESHEKLRVDYRVDADTLIAASFQHGLDSDPGHEAGDLQDYLRAGWRLLTTGQRREMLNEPTLKSAIETATLWEPIRLTKFLLQAEGIEKILDIFQEHGNDEGSAAEIKDLQDALRVCWGVLPQDMRKKMLDIEGVQDTFENATGLPLLRYLVSPGWEHFFVGERAETTRWIFDLHDEALVGVQVLNGSDWIDLYPGEVTELLRTIKDSEVLSDPKASNLIKFAHLPSWDEVDRCPSSVQNVVGATKNESRRCFPAG